MLPPDPSQGKRATRKWARCTLLSFMLTPALVMTLSVPQGSLVGLPEAPIVNLTLERVRLLSPNTHSSRLSSGTDEHVSGDEGGAGGEYAAEAAPWICSDVEKLVAIDVIPPVSHCTVTNTTATVNHNTGTID